MALLSFAPALKLRRPEELFRRLLAVLLLLAAVGGARASSMIDSMLENFQRSEFAFGRTDSNAPFPPMAWIGPLDQGKSTLTLQGTPVEFDEKALTQFLLAPVWIGKKDMVLAGEYAAWQRIDFNTPVAARRDVYTFLPLLAWLRQTGARQQTGAFIAPQYTHGSDYAGHEFTEWSGYAGVIGINWTSDRVGWAYGLVGSFSSTNDLLFPYVGCIWQPTPQWTVTAIAPWPSVSYAPTHDYLFQVGLTPADATLVSADDGSLRATYTSWNLLFGVNRRLVRNFWVTASVGWAGLGNFAVSTHGSDETDYALRRDIVWSLQFSFRPPTNGPMRTGLLPR